LHHLSSIFLSSAQVCLKNTALRLDNYGFTVVFNISVSKNLLTVHHYVVDSRLIIFRMNWKVLKHLNIVDTTVVKTHS